MTRIPYEIDPDTGPAPIGLIVLQADETLEPELHRTFRDADNPVYISRIASQPTVNRETLASMERDLTGAAALLPPLDFPVVGYGCTSASTVIGSDRIEALVKAGCATAFVTNPVRATLAHAADLGVSKVALVSPYVDEVNTPLRETFAAAGLSMDVFASFGVETEREVARISAASVIEAACQLGQDSAVEAVFLSCTNLRTFDAAPVIEDRIGKPVISSNSALLWHLRTVALTAGN